MEEEQVQVTGHSAADPAAVWAVAGDFCGAWHPAIAEIRAERDARGALIRAFTAKGEDTLYREQLVYRSDSDRVLVYTHLEGIAGVDSYVARLEVSRGEDGGSRIEWSACLTAEDERASRIAAGTRAIFEMGIEALAHLGEDTPLATKGGVIARGAIPPSVLPDISPSRDEIRWGRDSSSSDLECSATDVDSGQRKGVLRISPLEGEMPGRAEGGAFHVDSATESILIDGDPRLALTVAYGDATGSPFSPWGEVPSKGEAMRGSQPHAQSALEPLIRPSGPPSPQGEKGRGTLILFLHGIGGGRTNWLPQLATAAPYARAAALDFRGYGGSQLGPSQSTVDDHCADILRIMDSLGASHLILCGLSYGSWIATSFAMRHPEKLAGLVLSGGCTGMSETGVEERETFRQSRQVPLDQGKSPADFAPAVVNVLAGPDADDDVRRQLTDSMAAIPSATYRDALNCFTRPTECFDFSKLTMPVLMMTGEFDRLAPPAEIRGVARRIVEAAPNAYVRFEIIAGAGHVCNVERPDAYNAVLTEFLSEVIR